MNNRLGLLGGLLALQLLIVATFLFAGATDGAAQGKLIDIQPEAVDGIVISDGEQEVSLTRDGDGWTVGSWPADALKVSEFLEEFGGMTATWPVSESGETAERFEVTEANFQRRIDFQSADSALAQVFLGTSPGYQRVHARVVGSDSVYAISYSNFKAAVNLDDWLDKAMLAASGPIQSVRLPDGSVLARGEEGWLLNGRAADQDAARSFADRFTNMRILGAAEKAPDGAEEKGTIEVVDAQGTLSLVFAHDADEDDYYVRSSRADGTFEMATYIAEMMLTDGDALKLDAGESGETPADQ